MCIMAVTTHRIVIMGSGGVGKTSLISRFMTGQFPYGYYPTIENIYKHQMQTPDGQTHSLELMDTAGLHIVPSMQKLSIKSGKAFVLVYDISNVMSFLNALDLVDEINTIKGVNHRAPIVILGNKCDASASREVEAVEAQSECVKRNCAFMEVSAKENSQVNEAFMVLLNKLLPKMPQYGRKKKNRPVKSSNSKMEIIAGVTSQDDTVDSGGGDRGGTGGAVLAKVDNNGRKKSKASNLANDKGGESENNDKKSDAKGTKTKGKNCIIS